MTYNRKQEKEKSEKNKQPTIREGNKKGPIEYVDWYLYKHIFPPSVAF
jgi:hypothetical protein